MQLISQSQINRLLNLKIIGGGGATPYWPGLDIGQNMPGDSSYTTMRIFNDRVKSIGKFFYPNSSQIPLPNSSLDPNTSFPTVAFAAKFAEGALQVDSSVTGTWYVTYTAPSIRAPAMFAGLSQSAITNHTFAAGKGSFRFVYTAGLPALMFGFSDSGVTDFQVYDPTTSAAAIAGTVPGLWNLQFLRTTLPYAYFRFMDAANTNSDWATITTQTWRPAVAWADRATPANFQSITIDGQSRGYPLEYLNDLMGVTDLNGWFNIPELATDDYITQYATMVANNLGVGKWAGFELGNERWNTSNGFFTYRKAGVAAMIEANVAQPLAILSPTTQISTFSSDGTTATVVMAAGQAHGAFTGETFTIIGLQPGYEGFAPTGPLTVVVVSPQVFTYPCTQASTGGTSVSAATVLSASGGVILALNAYSAAQYSFCLSTISADGINPGVTGATSTATAVFNQPHGATENNLVKAVGWLTGYTGFAPVANARLHIIDAYTITYPCTQPSTGAVRAGLALSPTSATGAYIALNGGSDLFSGNLITNVYSFSEIWHIRRAWQMAKLVKDAFIAVGRGADCKPIFAAQAGNAYFYGLKHFTDFINAYTGAIAPATTPLSTRFTALAVGGYLSSGQNGGVLNPGFASQLIGGVIKSATDSNLSTEAGVAGQMQEFADRAFGAYSYQAFMSFVHDQGCEAWGYEIGNDLAKFGGETVAIRQAKVDYQNDYANYGAQQQAMYLKWIRNFPELGFSKIGWYQCGAGTYTDFGTFNLGRTADEIDATTAPSGQSPKLKAILAAQTPPGTFMTRHAFPCVLDGRDCVGNEGMQIVSNVFFALSTLNHPYFNYAYAGPLTNGLTYAVWSEITQVVTVNIVGDNTNAATRACSVKRLGGSEALFTVAGSKANALLGTVQITLKPGPNYVFISATAGNAQAASVFIRQVQFL